LSVLLSFSFGHCFVCSSVFFFWSLFCLFFCLFLLVIVLSVLRYTNSDYPFGIFKLFKQRYSGNASWYFWVDGNMCSYFFLYSCIVIKDSIIKLGVMIPWIPLISLIRPYYLPIAMVYQMFEVRVVWHFYIGGIV
jgi:hypothetical protein